MIDDDGLDLGSGDGGAMPAADEPAIQPNAIDTSAWPAPNDRHVQMLKGDPTLADHFERKFGPGSASKALGVGVTDTAKAVGGMVEQQSREHMLSGAMQSLRDWWQGPALGEAGYLKEEDRQAAAESELSTARTTASASRSVAEVMRQNAEMQRSAGPTSLTDPRMLYLPGHLIARGVTGLAEGLTGAYADDQEKRLKQAEKMVTGEAEQPKTALWRSSVDKLAQSVLDFAVAKPIEFSGIVGGYAGRAAGFDVDPARNMVVEFGKGIEDKAKQMFPDDIARQKQFVTHVSQGIGSTAAFYGSGLLVRLMGAGEKGVLAAIALGGAAGNVPEEFDKATKALDNGDASEWDRFINMLADIGLGATEAFPFAGKVVGTGMAARAGRAGAQFGEEAGQEFIQQLGTNVAAKVTYDPSRDPYEGVLEGTAVAGITGGMFGLASKAETEPKSKGKGQQEAKVRSSTPTATDASPTAPAASPLDGYSPAQRELIAELDAAINGGSVDDARTARRIRDLIPPPGSDLRAWRSADMASDASKLGPIRHAMGAAVADAARAPRSAPPTDTRTVAPSLDGPGKPLAAGEGSVRAQVAPEQTEALARVQGLLRPRPREDDETAPQEADAPARPADPEMASETVAAEQSAPAEMEAGDSAPVESPADGTATPDQPAAGFTKDPLVETVEQLASVVGRPIGRDGLAAIAASNRASAGEQLTGTEKFNAGQRYEREIGGLLTAMTPQQWAAVPKHVQDDLQARGSYSPQIRRLSSEVTDDDRRAFAQVLAGKVQRGRWGAAVGQGKLDALIAEAVSDGRLEMRNGQPRRTAKAKTIPEALRRAPTLAQTEGVTKPVTPTSVARETLPAMDRAMENRLARVKSDVAREYVTALAEAASPEAAGSTIDLLASDKRATKAVLDEIVGTYTGIGKKSRTKGDVIKRLRDAVAAGPPVEPTPLEQANARAAVMADAGLTELATPDGVVGQDGEVKPTADRGTMMAALAGQRAANAPRSMLTAAKRLEARGRSPEQIFRQTGWFKGQDQKWRFEIDDSGAKLVNLDKKLVAAKNTFFRSLLGFKSKGGPKWATGPVRAGTTKLADILDHPKLFTAYPFLSQMSVSMVIGSGVPAERAGGALIMRKKDGRIVYAPISVRAKNEAEALQTLMHEVQHYIQEKEGFSTGSSPSTNVDPIDPFTADFTKESEGGPRVPGRSFSADTQSAKETWFRGWGDNARSPIFAPTKAENYALALADLNRARDRGTTTARDLAGNDVPIDAAIGELQANLMNLLTVHSGDYVNSLGEIEANTVMDRLKMTPTERRQSIPMLMGNAASTGSFADAADETLRRAGIRRRMQEERQAPVEVAPNIWMQQSTTRDDMLEFRLTRFDGQEPQIRAVLDYDNGRGVMWLDQLGRDDMGEAGLAEPADDRVPNDPVTADELSRLADAAEKEIRRRNLMPTADARLLPQERVTINDAEHAFWVGRDPYFMIDDPRTSGPGNGVISIGPPVVPMPIDMRKARLDEEAWKARTEDYQGDSNEAELIRLRGIIADLDKELDAVEAEKTAARVAYDGGPRVQTAWEQYLKRDTAAQRQRENVLQTRDKVRAQITRGPLRDLLLAFKNSRIVRNSAGEEASAEVAKLSDDKAFLKEAASAVYKYDGDTSDLGGSRREIAAWLSEDLKQGEDSNIHYYGVGDIVMDIARKRSKELVAAEERGRIASADVERIGDEITAKGGLHPYTLERFGGEEVGTTMFAFAGTRAATADKAALERAEAMEAAGPKRGEAGYEAHRTAIWNATGWFRGVDGKWRFEIDDRAVGVRSMVEEGEQYQLDEAVRHTLLYRAYDAMRSMMAYPVSGKGGSYLNGDVTFGMAGRGTDAPASIALHEMQHGIQQMEGFARGGSPATEAEALQTEAARRVDAMVAEVRSIEQESPQVFAVFQRMNAGIAEKNWDAANAAEAELLTTLDGQRLSALAWSIAELEGKDYRGSPEAYQAYQRLAGEVEARTVERRRLMTPAERKALPPWLSYDVEEADQIVRFRSGVQARVEEEIAVQPPPVDYATWKRYSGVRNVLARQLGRRIHEAVLDPTEFEIAMQDLWGDARISTADIRQVAEAYTGEPVGGLTRRRAELAIRNEFARRRKDFALARLSGLDAILAGSNLDPTEALTNDLMRLTQRLPEGVGVHIAPVLRVAVGRGGGTMAALSGNTATIDGAVLNPAGASARLGIDIGANRRLLALSLANGPDVAMQTLTHEEIHALRAVEVFTDAQWTVLSSIARKKPRRDEAQRILDRLLDDGRMGFRDHAEMSKRAGQLTMREIYKIDARYKAFLAGEAPADVRASGPAAVQEWIEDKLVEEVVAHAAADWADGRSYGTKIDRVMMLIRDFIESLGNFMRGNGYTNVNEIFESVWSGEMVRQAGKAAQRAAESEAAVQEWMAENDVTAMAVRPEMMSANLDMSPEARKARAETMGLDINTVWYHGTLREFDAFDLSRSGENMGDATRAVFLTTSPRESSAYSRDELDYYTTGSRVIPLYAPRNLMVIDREGLNIKRDKVRRELAMARRKGFDGVRWNNTTDLTGEKTSIAAVFRPRNLRSVNASFDPRQTDIPDLMASLDDRETGRSMRRDLDAERQTYKLVGGPGDPPEIGRVTAALKAMASQLGIANTFASNLTRDVAFIMRNPELGTKEEAVRYVQEQRRESKDELATMRREAEGQSFYYDIQTGDAESIGSAHGWVVGNQMYFDWIGAPRTSDKANIGLRAIKDLREQVRKDFPQVTEFVGYRVSGAREKADAANRLQSVTMFAFAGERAKTADKAALARAQEMEAAGRTRDEVWAETGWFRGVDRKWRFEIDDSQSEWAGPAYAEIGDRMQIQASAGRLFAHEELRAAYPGTSDTPVQYFRYDNTPMPFGSYNIKTGGIRVRAVDESLQKPRSTMLHEGQHELQAIEGFANGGDPKAFEGTKVAGGGGFGRRFNWTGEDPVVKYRRLAGEVEARTVQKRMDMTTEERRARPPWLDYDIPEAQQIVRFANGTGVSQSMAVQGDDDTGTMMASLSGRGSQYPTLNKAIADLKEALGIAESGGTSRSMLGRALRRFWTDTPDAVVTQGLRGVTIQQTSPDVGGVPRTQSVKLRPRSNVRGQYDRTTGVISVRSSRDIKTIAHEGGHGLERLLGTTLDEAKAANWMELLPATDATPPPMAATGYSGIDLDTFEQGLLTEAVQTSLELRDLATAEGVTVGERLTAGAVGAFIGGMLGAGIGTALGSQASPIAGTAVGTAGAIIGMTVGATGRIRQVYGARARDVLAPAATRASEAYAELSRAVGGKRAAAMIDDVLAETRADVGAYVRERFSETGTPRPRTMPLPDGAALSEAFARWFERYVMDPDAAQREAPRFHEAFEDMLDAEAPGVLTAMHQVQITYRQHMADAPVEQLANELVSRSQDNAIERLAADGSFDNITGKLSTAYNGIYDDQNPIAKIVQRLLFIADRNGVRDDEGRPISLKVGEQSYKLLRMFRGSFNRGRMWLEQGIADLGTVEVKGPSLRTALETAFGGTAKDAWNKTAYAEFGAYLVSRRAVAEYDRLERKQAALANYDAVLDEAARRRRELADAAQTERTTLDRRETALIRDQTRLTDAKRARGTAETALRRLEERLRDKADDVLAAQMARDGNLELRRKREMQTLQRDARRLVGEYEAAGEAVDGLEISGTMLEEEIEQRRQTSADAAARVAEMDDAVTALRKERDRTEKAGASRPPTLQSKEFHQRVLADLDAKYAGAEGAGNFRDAAAMVHEWTHRLLTVRWQAGFLSDELYQELASRRDYYVPFQRDMSDGSEADVLFRGGAAKWSPFKKFDGSDRAIINPLETLSQDAYTTAQQIAFNDSVNTLVSLAERAGPGGGTIAERVPRSETMPANETTFERLRQTAIGLGIDPTDAHMIVQRMEQSFSDADITVIWSPDNKSPTAPPQMPLWVGGERQMVRINDRDFGRDAFNAINGLGAEMSSLLLEWAAAPARWLRMGVTTHPNFILRNLLRDIPAAYIRAGVMPFMGHAEGLRMLRNNDTEVRGSGLSRRDFLRLYNEVGGIVGGQNVASVAAIDTRTDVLDLRNSGPMGIGRTTGEVLSSVSGAMATGIGGLMAGGAAATLAAPLGPFAMGAAFLGGTAAAGALAAKIGGSRLVHSVEAIESAGRLGIAAHAYRRAIEHNPGLTQIEAMQEAAFVARDVYDWSRRGSKMLALNRIITFLNANLQGTESAVRGLIGSGDRGMEVTRKDAGLIAATMAAGVTVGGATMGPVGVGFGMMASAKVAEHLSLVLRRESDGPVSKQEERDLAEAYKTWFRMSTTTLFFMLLYAMMRDDPWYEDIKDGTKSTHSWARLSTLGSVMAHRIDQGADMLGIKPQKDAAGEQISKALGMLGTEWAPEWLRRYMQVPDEWRIPKPFEWAVPGNIAEMVFDRLEGRDPRAAERIRASAWEVLAPPGMPQVIEMGVGMWSGYDIRKGKDIVPDNLKKLAPHQQFDAFASELAIDVSKGIYDVLGKFGAGPDRGPSPKMIDWVLSNQGAYWGKDIANAWGQLKSAAGMSNREASTIYDAWMVAGITGRGYRNSKSIEEFWKLHSEDGGKFAQAFNTYKGFLDRSGDPGKAAEFLARLEPEERAYAVLKQHFKANDERSHPIERAAAVYTVNRDIRKDMILGQLTETNRRGQRDFDQRIILSPAKQTEVHDILERLSQIEVRNSMILMDRQGWKGRPYLDPQPVLDELKASSPEIYEVLETKRSRARVRDWEDIKQSWPANRTELLTNGPAAALQ